MNPYFAGIDIGSTMTKVAVISNGGIVASHIGPTGPEHRRLANKVMENALVLAGIGFHDVAYVVATGYGRINVPFADKQITEITCHAKGLHSLLPTVKTIIDIGGQDSKGIKLKDGKVVDFVMNDKCAAGTGRFLEVTADALGISLESLGELSVKAEHVAAISSTCTVYAEQEIVSRLAEGEPLESLIAGIHDAIAARVVGMVNKLKIEPDVAVTGGGAKNRGLVKAIEARLGYHVLLPPEPLLTGAIGAALAGRDAYEKLVREGGEEKRVRGTLEEATFFHD